MCYLADLATVRIYTPTHTHTHTHGLLTLPIVGVYTSCSSQLVVPRRRLSTLGRRSFSITGPMFCNSLLEVLRDPAYDIDTFSELLKTYHFPRILVSSVYRHIRGFHVGAVYKIYKINTLTCLYLLTYLRYCGDCGTL